MLKTGNFFNRLEVFKRFVRGYMDQGGVRVLRLLKADLGVIFLRCIFFCRGVKEKVLPNLMMIRSLRMNLIIRAFFCWRACFNFAQTVLKRLSLAIIHLYLYFLNRMNSSFFIGVFSQEWRRLA